jgi:hypothetical protein
MIKRRHGCREAGPARGCCDAVQELRYRTTAFTRRLYWSSSARRSSFMKMLETRFSTVPVETMSVSAIAVFDCP